jgi:hypothetical protein
MDSGEMKKAKPATDRVAIPGGAACPRCAATMQRFRRPKGYKPKNETPFHSVQVWDRCSCGWIARLEEAHP